MNDKTTAMIRAATRLEPYVDAIICYASTMDEHEPNRIAHEFRQALAAIEQQPAGGGEVEAQRFERERKRAMGQFENGQFKKWWKESGHEEQYDLTTENACHATWQQRATLEWQPPQSPQPGAEQWVCKEHQIRAKFGCIHCGDAARKNGYPRLSATPDTSAVELVRELVEAIKKNKNVIDDVCRLAGSFVNMGVHQEYRYARTVAADTLTKAEQWLKKQGA